jgi:alpha-maltose-1-phosphate synthase
MTKKTFSIVVTHPGTQHSRHTAYGLQKAGFLKLFVTTFYLKKTGITWLICNKATKIFRLKILKKITGRTSNQIEDSLVKSFLSIEVVCHIASKLPILKNYSEQISDIKNLTFDHLTATSIRGLEIDAVICYDTCSKKMFRTAETKNACKILDQSIGHLAHGAKLLEEEKLLHPDFSDSIPTIPRSRIEYCIEEAKAADAILVASNYARMTLNEIGIASEKIYTINYGADVTRFSPAPEKSGKFRFLFVGAVTQRKGVKYLLEAFKALKLKDAELIIAGPIVGSGNGLKNYSEIFTYRGQIPYAEIPEIFRSADVFVLPSLHEGGVIASHEALASGLPVITTPNAGSVVRDNIDGFIVPIRDVDALMEKMLLLYQNKELRKELSINARSRGIEFTWDKYYKDLAKTVEEIIDKHKTLR